MPFLNGREPGHGVEVLLVVDPHAPQALLFVREHKAGAALREPPRDLVIARHWIHRDEIIDHGRVEQVEAAQLPAQGHELPELRRVLGIEHAG